VFPDSWPYPPNFCTSKYTAAPARYAYPRSISRAIIRIIPGTLAVARGMSVGSLSASIATFSPNFRASSRNRPA
jgi:hypothetical protein